MAASRVPALGLAHRLWRWLPATLRRRALASATALLAPRPDPSPAWGRHGVVIAGYLSTCSGLGEAARLMVRATRALGVPVWTIDLPDPGAAFVLRSDAVGGPPIPKGAPLILHVNAPLLPLTMMRLPRGLIQDRRVIAHWSWELPIAPPEWTGAAPLVHEIWVPSRFTQQAIEPLKPHRVHVVPPALALAPPVPSLLGRGDFGLPDDAIVVLFSFNLASSFARKNPLAAIAAFRAAFGDRPDRVLAIKVCHVDHAPDDFARLQREACAPNIRFITGELPEADRHALTTHADIVLSLHRSEGFGLVPAEAMMLGKPVIATGWSGNMDFMDGGSAALVRHTLVPAVDPRSVYRGAAWADPDVADAAAWLRRLADDRDLRRTLGEAARASVTRVLDGGALRIALRATGLAVPPRAVPQGTLTPVAVQSPVAASTAAPAPANPTPVREPVP